MMADERVARRLKLRDLQIFMEVVNAGSMGKAAERLHVTQPVVSKAVAGLEHTLGVRLLDRTFQGVELTDYGRAVLKGGIAVADDIRQTVEEIGSISDPAVGTVRVGCTEPEFAGIVPAIIDRLTSRYSRIQFLLMRSDQLTPYRELEARNVDLVIARLNEPVREENLAVEVLFVESMVLAVGLQHPLANRRRIDLVELADEYWILPPPESFASKCVVDAFRARGLRAPRPTVVCTSTTMRIALLASGRYLTPVPGATLRSGGRRMVIKALPVALPQRDRTVGIVTIKARSLNPSARAFVECAREIATFRQPGTRAATQKT
jgi:DNA-binding transcriptional LysR family regulator